MVAILREADKEAVGEAAKRHGISEKRSPWCKRFGAMEAVDVKRLRQLEQESARLKKIVADRDLGIEVMKKIAAKSGERNGASAAGDERVTGAKMVCDNLNALAAYLATEQHLAPGAVAHQSRHRLQPFAPPAAARPPGVVAMTSRLALFSEISANLQKFMPHRNRPRPVRPKPHKAHAYKPCL